MIDVLQSYGYINPEERPEARGFEFLTTAENSAIHFNRAEADFQFDRVRGMVAQVLDDEPDVLITLTAPVTLAALQATSDLPDPPAIFFADIYSLYESGVADAACIKPAHATGVETVFQYDEIVDLLLMQNPDLQTIGTIHSSSDASGSHGAANEYEVPVFYSELDGLTLGATVSAGFFQAYAQGERIGVMVAAYLNGELDLASTGISQLRAKTPTMPISAPLW